MKDFESFFQKKKNQEVAVKSHADETIFYTLDIFLV